jgi:hypothetical protein
VNPGVNAITVVLGDRALGEADGADRAIAAGADVGPFHGVPFTIKENIDVLRTPTTQGLAAFSDEFPAEDAPVVGLLDGMRILDRFEGTWEGLDALFLRVAYQPSLPERYREDATSLPGQWAVDVLCAAVRSPAELPELRVGRLRWVRHLAESAGFRDIGTESWRFNRRWHISARDPRFANDLIDQRMMSFLMRLPHRFDFMVGGPWLLVLGPR